MNETGEDRVFYAAAEAAFIGRRGTPFLLSPRDFVLLKQWRELGVSIEAIEQGIDDAFSRREERAAVGRINSLAYCRDAVLAAWERRSLSAVGRGDGRESGAVDSRVTLEGLTSRLEDLARLRPGLGEPLAAAARSLRRLLSRGKPVAELERSLARLDRQLASSLYDALPAPERQDLDARVERLILPVRSRMDEETAEKTARALTRRTLREMLDLPRLTLL